jgi:hypothetical protein
MVDKWVYAKEKVPIDNSKMDPTRKSKTQHGVWRPKWIQKHMVVGGAKPMSHP